jgi:formylglycine-generating enzyme required for sulfatase activity
MIQAKKKVIIRRVIKRKPKSWFGKRELVVIIIAIALTTLGIKASDTLFFNNNQPAMIDSERCPIDMVFIISDRGGFCIDKYEASAGGGCPNLNPKIQVQTKENLNQTSCYPVSVAQKIPWRNISQNQAAIACAKAGKRLPSNKEWLQAAMGTPDKEKDWASDDCQVAKNWSSQPGETGSGKNCQSAVGAFDMIGNVWEWVDGTITDGAYQGNVLPDEGYVKGVNDSGNPSETDQAIADPNYNSDYLWIKKTGTRGFSRGGYWDNKVEAGQYSVYLVSSPSFAGVGVGFRCVK